MSLESDDMFLVPKDEEQNDNIIKIGGFRLDIMIYLFCALGLFLFAVYLLWNSQCSPCSNEKEEETKPIIKASSIVAYELEPGIVVMQSQDGEFFRILHEYNPETRGTKHYGALGPSTSGGADGTPVHYIPHYTRAVLQTQPSAPMSPDVMNTNQPYTPPPPYNY